MEAKDIMRLFIFSILLCFSYQGFSQSTQSVLKPGLTFSLNSNGIAPIPAFSLGKPAAMASANLTKGRFSYDPVLAYSLDARPWFIDNWFRYILVAQPTFELRTGVNISTFFSRVTADGDEMLKGERYFAFAVTGTYKLSPASTLTVDYWSDNGQDKGSLRGHFIDLVYDRSVMRLAENVLLSVNLMLFYINYDGDNDGLFVSPTITLSMKEGTFALFFQGSQAIRSNIEPWPGFRWNVGISHSL